MAQWEKASQFKHQDELLITGSRMQQFGTISEGGDRHSIRSSLLCQCSQWGKLLAQWDPVSREWDARQHDAEGLSKATNHILLWCLHTCPQAIYEPKLSYVCTTPVSLPPSLPLSLLSFCWEPEYSGKAEPSLGQVSHSMFFRGRNSEIWDGCCGLQIPVYPEATVPSGS